MQTMAARAVLGLLFLLVVLGVALFVPAGTLQYWQAWLYLAVFGASAGLITLYLWTRDPQLLQRRLSAGPAAEQRPTQRVIQAVASVAFIGLFVGSALDRRVGWSGVPAAATLVAEIVVALGFAIVFVVFRENTFTTATIEVAAEQSVVSSGPYAFVRHPMYAGALLMLLATPVALGSWWGLAMFVPIGVAIVWRLLDEEKFLAMHLRGYEAYRARVRQRLVPGVW